MGTTPAPQRLAELRRLDEAPAWSVRYGAEFWRKRPELGAAIEAEGLRASPELDLNETIERVNHAFVRDAAGVIRSESSTFSVEVDGTAVRFAPGQSDVEATLALRSIGRGDAAWKSGDGGDAFVLGNTLQRRLAVGDGSIVEHVESRADGVEITWVLPERPSGEGPLQIALAIDGLTSVGRSASGHHFADAGGIARMRVSDAVLRDSAGGEWKLEISGDAHGLHLDVPAEILAAATYPLAIDPVVSAEVGMDTPVTGGVANGTSIMRIACGAGTCLAVWSDYRTGSSAVRGTRFDAATGTVQDPLGLVLASGGSADVGFNGTDFLIVYTDGSIRGRIVTSAGTTPAPAFVIGTGYAPTLAMAGTTALVAYQRYGDASSQQDILASIVSGTTVTATNIVVSSQPYGEYEPRAAWDGQGFLVTWYRYTGSEYDVWISRLSTAGAVTAAPAVLSGAAGNQVRPNVCGGGSGGGSLVGWYDYATGTNVQRYDATFTPIGSAQAIGYLGSYFACDADETNYLVLGDSRRNRIDKATGALLAAAPGLVNPTNFTDPDVVFDGTRFVTTYGRYDSGDAQPYVTRIASDNSIVDSTGIVLQAPAAGQTYPATAFDGTNHMVLWAQTTAVGKNVRGVVIDPSGVVAAPAGFTVGTTQTSYGGPSITYGGGRYLAVWRDASSQLKAARILPNGTIEDATPLSVSTSSSVSRPEVAYDGSRFVVTWSHYGGATTVYDLHARTITTAGALGTAFAVAATPSYEYYPYIACLPGGRCLVAWYTNENSVSMARIDNGALLDTTPVHLAANGYGPRVATDGTNFIVVYSASGVRASRVAPDGTVLDPSPLTLSVYPEAVSFDGANYVLATSGGTNLRLEQVTPSGASLNPSGIAIAPSAYSMQSIAISRSTGTRRSLLVYSVYDNDPTIQNRRIKGRFVAFTSAPVATNASTTTPEDTALSIALPVTDSDGDPLTYTIVTDPSNGTLTGTGATRTYTPNANYNGSDSFTVKGNDGSQDSNTATVTITVSPVNDAPVANDASVTTPEDTAVSVALSATDIETASGSLTYSIVTGPTNGTLSGSGSSRTYTPNANFTGTDSFTWRAWDASAFSNTATVTITVTAANDAPVANAQSVTLDEDSSAGITLTGSDVEGDALTFAIVGAPAHGSLTGTPPNLTYTPVANYSGTDAFTFRVNDGTVDSATATVSITVNPVNDAPVASDSMATTAEDTAVAVGLSATDVDGGSLSYSIVTSPAHGTLSGTAPNLTYTPHASYNGADSFAWRANDGSLNSNTATVLITVSSVNDAPVASAQSVTTSEDSSTAITLTGSDVDGDTLAYAVVTGPAHGTLGGTAPNLTYTPAANYNGNDSFTFQVDDGTVDSAPATISITIDPVNDAPVAAAQSVMTDEDTAVGVTLSASDVDGDTLTYSIVAGPAHGTLTGTPPNVTYTPAANYHGGDSFTFKASDGTVDSNTATVTIAISDTNDAPAAAAQSVTTNEDVAVAITLSGSDLDGDTLAYAVVTVPAHGTLSGTAPNLTYTPTANYNGNDSFTFQVNDGTVDSAPATISVTINPVNDAPVAAAQAVMTDEDTAVGVTLSASDVDGDMLTYSIVAGPAHGTLTGTPPNVTYTPAANYHGSDSFTFKASDGTVDSNTATVSVAISGANDAPTAAAQSVTTNEDAAVSFTLTGSDVDGDTLSFVVVTQPAHGTLTGTAPNLTYTPAANYNGSDAFTFKVSDGTVDSTDATVTISVAPVNDTPAATAQSVTTAEDTAAAITLAGTDIDGDNVSFAIVASPAHGTLSGTAPALTYTPAADYHGADSFTFKVNDGTADSPTATVSITVTPVNDVPVASTQSVTTDEDTAVSITVAGSDADGDSLTYAVMTQPAHGTLSGTAPNLTYTPTADYHGSDSFTFKVNDGSTDSPTATVNISVTSVNDAPVAAAQTVNVDQGQQAAITLAATDVDGDALTYVIVTDPSEGALSGTPPNVTYTAPAAYRGSTTFTFTATDGTLTSAPATVTVDVNNGAPTVTAAADLLMPTEGEDVHFTATAADPGGDPLTFSWDFGDGTTSTDQNPTHAFADEGDYTVTVTVSDGLVTATASVEIEVQNGAPIVVPSSEAVSGDEATELTFTADVSDPGSGDTLTVVWDWGDGTAETTGAPATHTFADNGTYTVTVTVIDNDGASVVGSRTVSIGNVPPVPEAQDPLTTDAGFEIAAQLVATDRAGAADPLTWTLVDGPGTLTADGAYSWTPSGADAGGHMVTARVSDDDGGTNDLVFSIEVIARDDGCGCRTSRGTRGNALVFLGVLALVLRRRRARI